MLTPRRLFRLRRNRYRLGHSCRSETPGRAQRFGRDSAPHQSTLPFRWTEVRAGAVLPFPGSNRDSPLKLPVLESAPAGHRSGVIPEYLGQPESSTREVFAASSTSAAPSRFIIFMYTELLAVLYFRLTILLVRTKYLGYNAVSDASFTRTRHSPMGPHENCGPRCWRHRARVGSVETGDAAMKNENAAGLESPAPTRNASNHEHDSWGTAQGALDRLRGERA